MGDVIFISPILQRVKQMIYKKHFRTFHLPWSEGMSSDDKVLPVVDQFKGLEVVITEKRDGECTSLYRDGTVHARSIDGTQYPWQSYVKSMWSKNCFDLPEDWRVVGENLYARHSIAYHSLASWFEVFAIFTENGTVLSWDKMEEWCDLLSLETVPVLWRGVWNENEIREFHKTLDLEKQEGYVVRISGRFNQDNWSCWVGKWVRKGHVQTDVHWTKNWVTNKLGDK